MNSRFNYGCVFKITREDSLNAIEKNLIQMKQSGFNTVVVWPAAFWWEEKTAEYPFATGKRVLEFAEKHGLKIVMELAGQLTSMEYAPDFLMKDEYNAIDEKGNREFAQGSFGFLNYYHPEVKSIIYSHFQNVAKAYKDYSALLAYDIFNETMFHSFDEYTLKEFREWLKNKYGTIEKLNAVWERTYTDFSQITFEKWKWMSVMPEVDYKIFRRESIAVILKDWYKAVREVDNKHPIMADNVYAQASPLGLYFRPQDDFGLKSVVDEIGMSFYPKQKNGTFETALRYNIFDGFYSASKNEGFWIAEMQTHNQSVFAPTTCVDAAELKQWCLEGYSAGAKSLIYWMWRPFNKGLQTLGRGLVNYKNQPTERLKVAKELSLIFNDIGIIKPVKGEVAVLYDPLCEDITRGVSCCNDLDQNIYNLSFFGAYKAFLNNNIKCDITTIDNICDYKVIVLSNHMVIGEQTANAIENFVKNGGIVLADGNFGYVDETSLMNSTLPGGKLNSLIGQELFDFDNKSAEFCFEGETIDCGLGRNVSTIVDGNVVATFCDGAPAVVEKTHHKGKIITINTALWYNPQNEENTSHSDVFAKAFAKKYLKNHLQTDLDITVRVCENDSEYIIFVFNYTDKTQSGNVNLRGNINAEFNLNILPNSTKIIKIAKN